MWLNPNFLIFLYNAIWVGGSAAETPGNSLGKFGTGDTLKTPGQSVALHDPPKLTCEGQNSELCVQSLSSWLVTNLKNDWQEILGLCVVFVMGIIVSAGGIGGGGIYVTLLVACCGKSLAEAVPLSKAMIFFGSSASFISSVSKRNPAGKLYTNWTLAKTFTPGSLLGTSIGIVLNDIVSDVFLYVLFATVLVFVSIKTVKAWRNLRASELNACHEPPSYPTPNPQSPVYWDLQNLISPVVPSTGVSAVASENCSVPVNGTESNTQPAPTLQLSRFNSPFTPHILVKNGKIKGGSAYPFGGWHHGFSPASIRTVNSLLTEPCHNGFVKQSSFLNAFDIPWTPATHKSQASGGSGTTSMKERRLEQICIQFAGNSHEISKFDPLFLSAETPSYLSCATKDINVLRQKMIEKYSRVIARRQGWSSNVCENHNSASSLGEWPASLSHVNSSAEFSAAILAREAGASMISPNLPILVSPVVTENSLGIINVDKNHPHTITEMSTTDEEDQMETIEDLVNYEDMKCSNQRIRTFLNFTSELLYKLFPCPSSAFKDMKTPFLQSDNDSQKLFQPLHLDWRIEVILLCLVLIGVSQASILFRNVKIGNMPLFSGLIGLAALACFALLLSVFFTLQFIRSLPRHIFDEVKSPQDEKNRIQQVAGLGFVPWKIIFVPAVSICSGILSGLLGIGGGMVTAPLFVSLKLVPVSAVATASTSVMFTSMSTTLQFYLIGRLNFWKAIPYGLITIVSAYLGQLVIFLAAEGGRPSNVLLIVSVALLLSTLLTLDKAVEKCWEVIS